MTGKLTLSTVWFCLWEGAGRRWGWGWHKELAALCRIGKSCPEERGMFKKKKKKAEHHLIAEYFWLWDTELEMQEN